MTKEKFLKLNTLLMKPFDRTHILELDEEVKRFHHLSNPLTQLKELQRRFTELKAQNIELAMKRNAAMEKLTDVEISPAVRRFVMSFA